MLRRASEAEGRACAEIWRRLATLAAGSLNEEPLVRSSLERSLAADPDNSETANWLLRIYIDRGEIDEALPLLEQLTSRAERDGSRGDLHRLYFMQGRIEELREQPEQACAAYELSFRADATYVPNLLALGRLYLEAERFEDALRVLQAALLYQRTIRSQPRRAELFFLLGSVRSASGDRARAAEMFQRALATLPEHEGARAALDALEEA